MPYKVTDQEKFLKVEMSPSHAQGIAARLLYGVLEALLKHGRKPILVCATGCAPLSLLDLYVVARHVKDTPLRHGKIAFIYAADPALESSRFIETLGEGRRLNMAAFASEAEAERWLTGVTPSVGEAA